MTNAETIGSQRFDVQPLAKAVISKVIEGLLRIGSSLVGKGTLEPSLAKAITAIVRDTVEHVDDPSARPDDALFLCSANPRLVSDSHRRALLEHHPAELLMAAEVIHEAALRVLDTLPALWDSTKLAVILRDAIWRRFPFDQVAYMELVLIELARAHLNERLALARELHHRMARQTAIGTHRAESVSATSRKLELDEHLEQARRAVGTSADNHVIAAALRVTVGDRTVLQALQEFVDLHRAAGSRQAEVTRPTQPIAGPLSKRELEVLRLLAKAKSNREISVRLSIAEGTVKRHTGNIYGKLGARSRMEAVEKSRFLGFI